MGIQNVEIQNLGIQNLGIQTLGNQSQGIQNQGDSKSGESMGACRVGYEVDLGKTWAARRGEKNSSAEQSVSG